MHKSINVDLRPAIIPKENKQALTIISLVNQWGIATKTDNKRQIKVHRRLAIKVFCVRN